MLVWTNVLHLLGNYTVCAICIVFDLLFLPQGAIVYFGGEYKNNSFSSARTVPLAIYMSSDSVQSSAQSDVERLFEADVNSLRTDRRTVGFAHHGLQRGRTGNEPTVRCRSPGRSSSRGVSARDRWDGTTGDEEPDAAQEDNLDIIDDVQPPNQEPQVVYEEDIFGDEDIPAQAHPQHDDISDAEETPDDTPDDVPSTFVFGAVFAFLQVSGRLAPKRIRRRPACVVLRKPGGSTTAGLHVVQLESTVGQLGALVPVHERLSGAVRRGST